MINYERTLVFSDFHGDLEDINIIKRKRSKHQVEILPVDWRVISMVWRKHYGIYFRKLKHLFLENSTIYVHGGISLLSMMDPMILGNLYSPLDSAFRRFIFLSVPFPPSVFDNKKNKGFFVLRNNFLRFFVFNELMVQ